MRNEYLIILKSLGNELEEQICWPNVNQTQKCQFPNSFWLIMYVFPLLYYHSITQNNFKDKFSLNQVSLSLAQISTAEHQLVL